MDKKIKTWLVRGDTHGNFAQLTEQLLDYKPEETAVIILGDFGANFYLNKTDARKKKELNQFHYYIYAVRGNHEARPQDIPEMKKVYDEEVEGYIYYEPEYPYIRYFLDYGNYHINRYNCLIIGGAYSIDRDWRLMRAGCIDSFGNPDINKNNPKLTGWFANEQLSAVEMEDCRQMIKDKIIGKHIDFVLTHTCPTRFQPTDMFLHGVDQSKVDNSMEEFLEEISHMIDWEIWLFGHYHADRLEAPKVEMYFNNIDSLDNISHRWQVYDRCWQLYDRSHGLPWGIVKGPNFYK